MSAELHRGDLLTIDHPAHGRNAHTEHLSSIVEGHQRLTLERRIHATSVYESEALSSAVNVPVLSHDLALRCGGVQASRGYPQATSGTLSGVTCAAWSKARMAAMARSTWRVLCFDSFMTRGPLGVIFSTALLM